MRRLLTVLVLFSLLAATPVQAFDPAGADILGLRLGQSETEILVNISRQGAGLMPSDSGILARTRDGRLHITLDDNHRATQIRYIFAGRAPGEPSAIQTSIVNRFGQPDQARPMTWCRATDPTGICPVQEPSLVYLPETLTLVLQAHGR